MNPPRRTTEDYIQFLLATPKVCSATEAARVQPHRPDGDAPAPAHDAFTRLLHRLEPDPEVLWDEVGPLIRTTGGVLVLDDSVLDKPFAPHRPRIGRDARPTVWQPSQPARGKTVRTWWHLPRTERLPPTIIHVSIT